MTRDITTIRPNIGLGDLYFGATREHVRDYLGEPGSIEAPDRFSAILWWGYVDHQIIVGFEQNGGVRLTHLKADGASATLHGHKFIGLSSDVALELAEQCGLGGHFRVEDGLGWDAVFDQANLKLRFDDDTLWLISWRGTATKDDVLH